MLMSGREITDPVTCKIADFGLSQVLLAPTAGRFFSLSLSLSFSFPFFFLSLTFFLFFTEKWLTLFGWPRR